MNIKRYEGEIKIKSPKDSYLYDSLYDSYKVEFKKKIIADLYVLGGGMIMAILSASMQDAIFAQKILFIIDTLIVIVIFAYLIILDYKNFRTSLKQI